MPAGDLMTTQRSCSAARLIVQVQFQIPCNGVDINVSIFFKVSDNSRELRNAPEVPTEALNFLSGKSLYLVVCIAEPPEEVEHFVAFLFVIDALLRIEFATLVEDH